MCKRQNNTNIAIAAISLIIFIASTAFAEYEVGFEWRKATDHTVGTIVNSTVGNPNLDQLGNPAWSYEWFTTAAEDYNSGNLMYWASWGRWEQGPLNVSKWDQNTNYDGNWNTSGINSLVRWTNPTEGLIDVELTGRLRSIWGGLNWVNGGWSDYFVASPTDVRVVLGYYDSSEGTTDLLIDNTYDSPISTDTICNTFGECPYIDTQLDRSLSVDAGDSLFWTSMPLDYVQGKNRWITANDGPVRITLAGTSAEYASIVPEPLSSILFLSGSAVFVIRRYLRRRS